ncbi:UNVERIFIED_ORG: hypothetical protein [Escherichia phage CMSTMSU]
MKLKLQYNGFTLRNDTEFVNRSPVLSCFARDEHSFVITTVGDREVLQYAEHPEIDVPWYSEHMYMDMAVATTVSS